MIISPAFASETAHAAHGSLFQDPTYWVGVSFCLVVVLLAKPMGKAIIALLDKRADDIRRKLEEAEKLKANAEALLEKYQKMHNNVQNEIDALMQRTQNDIEKMKTDAQARLDRELKKKEEQSFKRLKNTKDELVTEIRDMEVNISLDVAKEILKENLTDEKREQIALKVIEELPSLLKEQV